MGKVRQGWIKRNARRIFEEYTDRVTGDFYENKSLILDVSSGQSKRVVNRTAGYLTIIFKTKDNVYEAVRRDEASRQERIRKRRRKRK